MPRCLNCGSQVADTNVCSPQCADDLTDSRERARLEEAAARVNLTVEEYMDLEEELDQLDLHPLPDGGDYLDDEARANMAMLNIQWQAPSHLPAA